MTKLFYEDIHITDFQATIMECNYNEKQKCYQVVLDQTAFFPEEGGQVADKGTLDKQKVIDVHIKEDIIYHFVKNPIPIGSHVEGHVDWTQRFDFMQQHSGEHIISGLTHRHFGCDNVGFHLGLSEVTLDFNKELSLEQLREIEKEANEVVWKNLPINITYPSKEELSAITYRSKIELNGQVRIVEIPGVDICACCAPHVETTGQIGLIKITNVQKHRGGVRVNILCGARAVADYTQKQNSVSDISIQLSAKQPEVALAVKRLKEESLRHKERANNLQADLLKLQASSLPSPDQINNPVLFVGSLDSIALRNTINSLTESYNGFCAIFSGDDENGYHFVIGSRTLDCRKLAASLKEQFHSKGGGTAPMIQGSITASAEEISSYFKNLSLDI